MTHATILNRWERAALLSLSSVLIAVSVICEVLLLTSQTHTLTDTMIANVTGAGLVGCQYAFAAAAAKFWQSNRYLTSMVLLIITVCLTVVSVSGTVGFLESRFQQDQQQALTSSDAYRFNVDLINSLSEQEKSLIDAANGAKDKGNQWWAGQLLNKAQELSTQRQQLVSRIEDTTAPSTSTTSVIMNLTGSYRWMFWTVLALLVDLCPIVALSCYGIQHRNSLTVVHQQHSSQSHTESERRVSSVGLTVDEIKQGVRHLSGDRVGIRLAMRELNTSNYARTKQAFEELVKEGFLLHQGKGYAFKECML